MKNSRAQTCILSSEDIQEIVIRIGIDQLMDQLISELRTAMIDYDPEHISIPIRSGFNYTEPHTGLVEWMPLHEIGCKVVNKIVGYHPENPSLYGLPTIISTFSSYDTKTGHLLCLMDGVLPTALRTGATSALATQVMAPSQSKSLGLIGCGAQAVTQLHALSRFFNFEDIFTYDIDPQAVLSFANRVEDLNIPGNIRPTGLTELVSSSDIICSATSIEVGEGPLFSDIPTKSHVHINAVGSDFPGKIELPLELLNKSFICPDFKAQAMKEGECQQVANEQIGEELFRLLASEKEFDHLKSERTVFDSTGWALEDQVVMDLLYKQAQELNIGSFKAIEDMPEDAKNPYHFMKVPTLSL